MRFFARILGVLLLLFGTVSLLSAMFGYRALRSEEISYYSVPMEKPGSPNVVDGGGLADASAPMKEAEFIRLFILPAFLIWIAGIVWVMIAFRWGNRKGPTDVPCKE